MRRMALKTIMVWLVWLMMGAQPVSPFVPLVPGPPALGRAAMSRPLCISPVSSTGDQHVNVEKLAHGICLLRVQGGRVQVRDAVVDHVGVALGVVQELAKLGSLHIRRASSHRFERLYCNGAIDEVLNYTLETGDLLRIHTDPVRFVEACSGHGTAFRDRCRFIDPCFVVVDKPAGLPCSPHVSNAAHVLHRCMLREFESTAPLESGTHVDVLIPLHRLDSCTTGLVALARTKDAARAFNALQEEDRSVQVENGADGEAGGNYLKIYRACFLAPISGPPAFLQLAAAAAATAAAAAAETPASQLPEGGDAAASARARVASVAPGSSCKASQAALECAGKELSLRANLRLDGVMTITTEHDHLCLWEATLQLCTGRTHQIRAQMASLGLPLLGDETYTGMSGHIYTPPSYTPPTNASELGEGAGSKDTNENDSFGDGAKSGLQNMDLSRESQALYEKFAPLNLHARLKHVKTNPEAPTGIGLQASQLSFLNVSARAPEPWWIRREF